MKNQTTNVGIKRYIKKPATANKIPCGAKITSSRACPLVTLKGPSKRPTANSPTTIVTCQSNRRLDQCIDSASFSHGDAHHLNSLLPKGTSEEGRLRRRRRRAVLPRSATAF